MKKIIFILITAASLVACQKSKLVAPEVIQVNNAPKYKTVTFGSETTTYTYDSYGRQVKLESTDGSRTETSYSSGKVIQQVFNASGVLSRTITIELNADGLQKKYTYSDQPGDYTTLEYNANKQLSKWTSFVDGETSMAVSHFTNQLLDSTRYFKNNVWNLTNVYTYHLDQPCVMNPENYGALWLPKSGPFMMKTLTHVAANGTVTPENYSYEYNAQGLVTKLTETTPNGTSVGLYTYH